MKLAIEIIKFSKNYGAVKAVKSVSLQIKTGELFGLIGPDGAGKTTLLRTICTLLKPGGGRIFVQGYDVSKDVPTIRSLLGYMPQRFSLYQDLTVEQNLKFFAEIFQVSKTALIKRSEQLFRFSRLEPFKNRKTGALSGGMKQKLALSCALIHTPEILVLDEPTFGVDPVSREEFWEILAEIRKEGTTILISTAYMDEADKCDRVALMHQGNFLSVGTPEEIKAQFPYPLYRVTGGDVRELQPFFNQLPQTKNTQLFGDALHVSFSEEPAAGNWKKWAKESGGNLQQWQPQPPSMEDIFMERIGEER